MWAISGRWVQRLHRHPLGGWNSVGIFFAAAPKAMGETPMTLGATHSHPNGKLGAQTFPGTLAMPHTIALRG